VEWIQGDACIKYVLKYVMKGADMAFVQMSSGRDDNTGNIVVDFDEFREMKMARFQTPNEAHLTLYGNPLVKMSHTV
jgi:hypothetical protein